MTLPGLQGLHREIERVRSGLPLSPNEERYVLAEATSTGVYGNPWTLRIRGPLDIRRLEQAVLDTCQRHEARRTGFEPSADGRFTRYVEAAARPTLGRLSMPGATPEAVAAAVRRWFDVECDLTPTTLNRFLTIRLGKEEHIFCSYMHHACNDGKTHDWATREILQRYAGQDFPPPTQYSDLWNRDWAAAPAYQEAQAFWSERLAGVSDVVGLPQDGGEPWSGPARHRLSPELVARAKAAAIAAGVSEFTLYYAVAQVLLTRLTGQRRVTSTFQSDGRRGSPGSEGVHGVFSNGLILATEVDEAGSMAGLAQRLRGEIRSALANEACPYHHVIRNTGVHPRFGVNWFPELPAYSVPGLEITGPEMSYGRWEYDLNFRFVRDHDAGAIDLILFFREDRVRRARAEAVARQFEALLDALTRDIKAPIQAVSSAVLAPEGLLPDPAASLPSGGGRSIQSDFLRRAQEAPAATALLYGGVEYSYGELERRSRALALRLRAEGVARGDRVAILAQRGPELVWSLLAAARLGAVFTVVDSAYPMARLEALLEVCGPRVLVVAGSIEVEDLAQRLHEARGLTLVDAQADGEAADSAAVDLDAVAPDDTAYILFTSGSTGKPKGVAVSHTPLSRFVTWQAESFGLRASDRFTMLSGLSHDPLLRDIFTPLSLGAALAIPDADVLSEPRMLAGWMRTVRATVAHITPALGQVLLAGASRLRGLPDLRQVFWGGDQLAASLVRELAGVAPQVSQANFYGSTETPQAAGVFRCPADGGGGRTVPVGKGSDGFQLLVVDAARRPVGVGEAGEIAVRSNYLSLGYVEAGRVVPPLDRGCDAQGLANIYYTGDRGLYLPDGSVLMLGRADDQVKVRGFRVELSEVTATLLLHPGVKSAIALPVGSGDALRIAAFVVARRPNLGEAEVLSHLGARLPAYMVPRVVHVMPALPLLPNGKADRRALQELGAAARDAPAPRPAAAANATERTLIAKWSAVLGQAGITRDASFTGLGGDSLSYVQVFLATEEVIGEAPSGWPSMTIAELAAARRRVSRFWSAVDTPILVRAVSIFMVVVGHMHLVRYGGGATAGLLIVSGFLFGGLQLREVFDRKSAQPVLKGLRRLFVPTMLFSLFLYVSKSMMGHHPDLSVLLLYGNFKDYSQLTGPRWGGNEFYLWFIYCTLQMWALLYLAVVLLERFRGFALGRSGFVLMLFLAGCLTRFVAPALFVPDFFVRGAPAMTMLSFLPTTHLSTLMLGALIAGAETRRERAGALGLLAAYAALTAHLYSLQHGLVIASAGLLMFGVRRMVLPKPLTSVVLMLSGASLFIYLTHFMFRSALHALGAPEWPLLHVAIALIGGVLVWYASAWVSARVARRLRQIGPPEPQATI